MKLLLVILFPCLLVGQIPADVKHVYAGVGISAGVGVMTYKLTDGRWLPSLGAGLASGILAGYAKEYVWDKGMGRGTFSKNDIICTAWGSMLGTICITVYFDHQERKKQKRLRKFYESY
jgi:hypothetical protein